MTWVQGWKRVNPRSISKQSSLGFVFFLIREHGYSLPQGRQAGLGDPFLEKKDNSHVEPPEPTLSPFIPQVIPRNQIHFCITSAVENSDCFNSHETSTGDSVAIESQGPQCVVESPIWSHFLPIPRWHHKFLWLVTSFRSKSRNAPGRGKKFEPRLPLVSGVVGEEWPNASGQEHGAKTSLHWNLCPGLKSRFVKDLFSKICRVMIVCIEARETREDSNFGLLPGDAFSHNIWVHVPSTIFLRISRFGRFHKELVIPVVGRLRWWLVCRDSRRFHPWNVLTKFCGKLCNERGPEHPQHAALKRPGFKCRHCWHGDWFSDQCGTPKNKQFPTWSSIYDMNRPEHDVFLRGYTTLGLLGGGSDLWGLPLGSSELLCRTDGRAGSATQAFVFIASQMNITIRCTA